VGGRLGLSFIFSKCAATACSRDVVARNTAQREKGAAGGLDRHKTAFMSSGAIIRHMASDGVHYYC
jgi:hypothetical protein